MTNKAYNKTMQRISLSIIICVTSFCLSACDDFLDNVPKGQKIPTTVDDFVQLIADEYTNCREDVTQAIILLNDRYVSPYNLSYYELWNANYNWNENANRIFLNKSDETTYYNSYAGISTANLVIENVPKATNGAPEERNQAIAQAKMLRAMKYFTLVNYYAKQYNATTAATDGGVPLITSAEVGAAYTQPSVQAIYDFILKDISDALPNLPERAQNILYADKATGFAFAARVFLQMGNYSDALNNAQQALQRNAKLFDWTRFYNNNISILGKPDLFQNVPSPLGYDFVENYNFCHGSSSNASSENQLRTDRGQRFEEGDAAFMSRWKIRTVAGDTYYYSNLNGMHNRGGMTTTEVYLIQAECLARKGDVSAAMDTLNKVRQARILPDKYLPLTASNTEDAVNIIRDVKANALILTIVPFCDARRLNLESAYARTFTKTENGQQLSLSPTSHLWVMPFPQGAVENHGNGTVTQNVEK